MRTVSAFVFIISFLVTPATCRCEDPKNISAELDPQPKRTVHERTFKGRLGLQFRSQNSFPTTLHNQGLATVGGPAHNSKTTAAVNGTEIKHKP